MDITLTAFSFGILGGVVRAGFLFLELYRVKRLSINGFLLVAITILLAGGLGGILFDLGWIFSMLGGYVSIDLLDSLAKVFKKKKIKIG